MSAGDAGDAAVLVFAKSPRPGQVKTRLIPALGAVRAAALHERMVDHALAQAVASGVGPVTLCCAPDTGCSRLQALARRHGTALAAQQGDGLGERMATALERARAAHEHVLLIGSDCPQLDAAVLRQARAVLADGVPVVLVPAEDGGYVLVGAAAECGAMFVDVPWGTPAVLAATRERLSGAALDWRELAPLRDVDRPADLERLPPGF